MRKVIRRAILVGHPGPEDNYLPGVHSDMERIDRWLRTPRGGGWMSDEIIALWSPSKKQLQRVVQGIRANYLCVYFTGHGMGRRVRMMGNGGNGRNSRFDPQGVYEWVNERWLCINDTESIRDIDLVHQAIDCEHILCDCCRTRGAAAISGIPEEVPIQEYSQEEFERARAAFDVAILNSLPGKMIIHAASHDQSAQETSEGGKFTTALLEGAIQWQTDRPYSSIPLLDLVDYTRWVLKHEGDSQTPEIVLQEGDLTVPFGIDTPWPWRKGDFHGGGKPGGRSAVKLERITPPQMSIPMPTPISTQNPAKGLLVLGGILVGIWLLGGFDDREN